MADTAAPNDGKPDDILEEAKEAFELCDSREADNRAAALDDLRFGLLDEQWDETIRKQRETDGRPCLTTNLLRPIAKQVKNDGRQNVPNIKVHPVDSTADVYTATLINGLIRNIEATSKADQAYDTGLASAVDGGWGYIRVNTYYADDDSFDLDIRIDTVPNPFSIWGDPHSSKADSSDWNVAFAGELMPALQFERKYPDANKVDWNAGSYAGLTSPWREGEEVFLCEYWTREEVQRQILLLSSGEVVGEDVYALRKGEFDALDITVRGQRTTPSHMVRQRLMTGAEVLEDRVWPGRYIPIIPVYGEEVNIKGKRHWRSLIRSAKSAQQKYNFWDTAATEMVANAPRNAFVGAKGSFVTDNAKWSTINKQSWAYVEYDPVAGQPPPSRPQQDFAGAAAALQQAMSASNDIKAVTGVHEPGLGAPLDAEASGTALLQMQQRSDTSTFDYSDNLSRAVEHVGRVIVDLIPYVYSGERIVRVMGPDGARLPPVQLGKPTQIVDAQGAPVMDAQGQPMVGVYDLAVGKYDLDVKTGPSFATQRQEAASQLIRLIEVYPEAAPILADLLVKMMDWPGAQEAAARLEAMLPQQLQGQNPQVAALQAQLHQITTQGAQQLQAAQDQARQATAAATDMQVKLDAQKADKTIATAQLQIDRYDAETNRLKAVAGSKGLPLAGDPQAMAALVAHLLGQLSTGPDISTDTMVGVDGQPLMPTAPMAPLQGAPAQGV